MKSKVPPGPRSFGLLLLLNLLVPSFFAFAMIVVGYTLFAFGTFSWLVVIGFAEYSVLWVVTIAHWIRPRNFTRSVPDKRPGKVF